MGIPCDIFCKIIGVTQEEIASLLVAHPNHIHDWLETQHDTINLELFWNGIHFLLTGSVEKCEETPLGFLFGGQPLTDQDIEYETGYYTPDQTTVIHQALQEISTDELQTRFEPEAFQHDIYPILRESIEEQEAHLASLIQHFQKMKAFLAQKVMERKGIIVYTYLQYYSAMDGTMNKNGSSVQI